MEAEKQRLVAQKFEQKARTGDVMIQEKTTFSGLMLAPEVLEGLGGAGFEVPSPIQLQAIPLGRAGLDLIVQAKSGTGKTCVFTVIALESINTENSCMQVVILAPTREIAVQIWEVIKSIGRVMEKLRCYVFIGGLNINDDKLKLKKCHIAVATPGRFRQLIELDAANVNSVRLFVLDEADKLLEAGFQDDINWIYSALPTNKQMIAASATYPEYLAQQLTTYMRSPKMIRLNACDPALLGISQYYVLLPFSSLPYKVYEEKSEFLLKLLSSVDFQQCLVFSNYQSRAQSLSKLLDSKGWPSTYICGSQEQEKRLTAMAKLRQYQCRVLISTDLTSRGIDVENVNLVVNLDLPTDHETYLHRIGRAGRYGSFGAAVTLVTQGRESADLRIIEARCQTSIQLLPDPIPEGLTHSCAKVDQNIEVTVEEAVHPNPLQDCLQVKMYEEAENIVLNETSDADVSKCTEQEFLLNDTTECEDHTTGLEDRSIGHEDHTTGLEDHKTVQEDHTTGHEDHTAKLEEHTTGHEDHTTEHEDHTAGHEDHSTGHKDHTAEHEDHTAGYEDHTTEHEDHTTEHEDHTTEHEDHTAGHEDHTTVQEDHTTGHEDHTTANEDHTTGHEDHTTANEDHTTGHEDHTTGHEDHTTGNEDRITGNEDHTTGNEDRITGNEDRTTGNEDRITGNEDHTAENEHNICVHEDHTTEHEELEDHSTEHEDHTVGHEDHITGNEDNTTKLEDSTTEHDETSVKSSANKVTPPAIDNKAQSAHVAVNGTLNVNSLCTFNIQHEGKSNESKAFAVGTDKPQEECSSAFLSGKNDTAVNDSESGNASRNELEALEKNGIVDDLGKNEVDTLNKSEIASFKADDVSSNESGDVPGNVLDITNGVGHDGMKIEVDDSNKQLNASDSLTTKIQPRGNHVERNLAWCSFLKETLPVSEQVLSLGELVSINKSYVSERNGDVDAGESDSNPKWMAEDLALPTDESVFEDIGRLIVNSDYSYATRFPCSAKLLGDMLDTETLPDFTSTKETFVSSDERRVNLSSGDTILQNSSAVEHLPNIETGVVQSGGDAFAQNFSGEECLPKKESQAAETTVKKEQTSDLQSVPKNVNTSSGTTHQEAKASRRVKWRREQLMGMERLAHNIVISPQVERLVQELCIKRGCEYPTHDTWEPSRRGNASRGRPGTKFGGRKQNYTSNWKEPLPRSSEVFNGAVEARSSTAPISTKSATHSSSYSIAEAATPSLPSNDSIDAKYSASLTSSSRIVEAVKPSTLSVPTNDSNDTTSTLVPPNDVVDTKSIASLTSSPEALTEYRHANPVASRSTATPSTSYMTMGSASPVVTPVGCNDTRSTATWTSTLQKSSNMSSHTYYSSYQVSEQVEVHYTIAEIKLPHMQSNQTMPTTVFEEPLVAVSSYPLSKTGKPSQSSDEQPMSYEPNEGESSIEPECDPVTLVSQSKYEQTEVILEESADTMLSWPASDEFTCIPDTSEAVHENHFQEIPVEMCRGSSGKFSELPCDSSSSPLPPREPLRLCTQVADEGDNQSLGRDYMLKLSACRDVIESSSDTSDVIESGFQDEFGELHWKPSAKQTRKKSSAEKKKRMSTSTKDQAGQTQHTKEHRENQRTTKVQKAASKECGINRDMTSSHEVHRSHRFHDDFVPQQPFQGWTHHKTHSHRDSASTRKVLGSRASAAKVEHSIPEQSFPGYANLDAYSSYYWNSYMAHLHNAEHFRQLLTSLTDQTRLQDIAVQQAAYIQHMIAFHRTS